MAKNIADSVGIILGSVMLGLLSSDWQFALIFGLGVMAGKWLQIVVHRN